MIFVTIKRMFSGVGSLSERAAASQLSAIEAAQLASALSGLAGGGGFDIIGGLREFAGLDRLRFASEASGVTVAGGKYISDNVYLEIIGGGREGAAVPRTRTSAVRVGSSRTAVRSRRMPAGVSSRRMVPR